ncbi:hypothetical protein JKF63_03384 [Porcisia hertigi]|uniref:Uncharacterized protein n=1 Tax=Porcisia hertigi TaxID=2761500 RepID=A0A836HYI8_9TRYP|nr:hypothetical protein JKF63_03384 [Porcisia hertigi]
MSAVAIGFVAFGLVCAVMFVSDIAEEHPSRAKWTLRALILFNFVVHTFILVVDQLSWWRSLLSLFVNVLYLRLLRTFPFVPDFNAPIVLTTMLAVLLESAMWYWYTIRLMYYTSLILIIGFFLMLWLVPIGLLSSCVMEDDRLPGGGGGTGATYTSGRGEESGSCLYASDRMPHGRPKRTVLNRVAQLFRRP